MDCREFYGQVARLQKIKDISDQFERVVLSRIENVDLNLFEFDFDLTMMIFFLDADQKVYARYGGRDAISADSRQSLDGLRYTMQSVMRMHSGKQKAYAQPRGTKAKYLRDSPSARNFRRRCMHCHQAKEALYSDLYKAGKWTRDVVWRYPPPDNLGFVLDVDRGNIVKRVDKNSPAAKAGLQKNDLVELLNNIPVHSFGDAQYSLDRAPKSGTVDIRWQRDGKTMNGKINLPEHWRKTDISWRASVWGLIPSLHVYGDDLTAKEKKQLGLDPKQTAFRQQSRIHSHARRAGILPGDVIIGVDGKRLEMTVIRFLQYTRRTYLVDDRVSINIIRDGKRMAIPMKLIR